MQRAGKAVKEALASAQPATHYGWGVARVNEVASNRRILGPDGKVRAGRYTATRDPALRAEPEGVIDPEASLLSFWNENRPIAVLSYYTCHPQIYYRTGIPSPDFPGIARFIRGQAVPEALHVHFNGAGGNIGAGKYNDGSKENRMVLAQRLADGMKQAFAEVKKLPFTTTWSAAQATRREDILPGHVGLREAQGFWQRQVASLTVDIALMQHLAITHLFGQAIVQRMRQHDYTLLVLIWAHEDELRRRSMSPTRSRQYSRSRKPAPSIKRAIRP